MTAVAGAFVRALDRRRRAGTASGGNQTPRIPRRLAIVGGILVLLVGPQATPPDATADTNPPDISGLQLWLKADEITGLSDGAAVATWSDASGAGSNATQGLAERRPIFKTNVVGGKPVVRFDGVDDYLATPQSASIRPFSIFAVVHFATAMTKTGSPVGASTNGGIQLQVGGTSDTSFGAGAFALNKQNMVPIAIGDKRVPLGTHILTLTYAPSGEFRLLLDGAFAASGTNNQGDFLSSNLWIGGNGSNSEYFSRDVGEVLVYNSALAPADRTAVESYLRNKWGTPAAATEPLPQDINGRLLWLKADSIAGVSDGGAVSSWRDSTGAGRHASQTDSARKPTLKLNASGALPAVRFDGVDDVLQTTASAANKPVTLFSVVNMSTPMTKGGSPVGASANGGVQIQVPARPGATFDTLIRARTSGGDGIYMTDLYPSESKIYDRIEARTATPSDYNVAGGVWRARVRAQALPTVRNLDRMVIPSDGMFSVAWEVARSIDNYLLRLYGNIGEAPSGAPALSGAAWQWNGTKFRLAVIGSVVNTGPGVHRIKHCMEPAEDRWRCYGLEDTAEQHEFHEAALEYLGTMPGTRERYVDDIFCFGREDVAGECYELHLDEGWIESRLTPSYAGPKLESQTANVTTTHTPPTTLDLDAASASLDGEADAREWVDYELSRAGAGAKGFNLVKQQITPIGSAAVEISPATHVLTASYGGTGEYRLYLDGTAVASGTKDEIFSSSSIWIGGNGSNNEFFSRDVGETLVYSARLSASDRRAVERYLIEKWMSGSVAIGQTFGAGIHAENPTALQADPVNSATGSFVTSATDASLPGATLPFNLVRSYNSADTTSGTLGSAWTHSYAVALAIAANGDVTLRAEDGQQVLYQKEPDGSFVPPAGGRSSLVAVAGGYELTRTDGVRYRFDSAGNLTELGDRNQQAVSLAYDASGRLATLTDTAGRIVTFTHNAAGLLSEIELPGGRSVAYGYTNGRLTSITDLRGETWRYEYDARGRLTRSVDARGNTVIENTYGASGRVKAQVDGLGNRTTFAWDAATQTATVTDPAGKTWQDVYANNVLRRRIDPLGNMTTYTYDADLNVTKIVDARGNATTMTYDGRGNLLTRKGPAPLSYTESWTYNGRNDVTSYADGRNNTTTYDYDAAGNLIRKTEPGSTVTEYGRDSGGKGLLVSRTDPRGKVTTFTYDASNQLTAITSPLGKKTTFGYDIGGRVTSVVEPRGNEPGATAANYTTSYTYDAAGNRLTATDPLGRTTTYAYDPNGNVRSVTNARNKTWTYAYNAANERTSETAPDNSVLSVAYDARGNITRTTSALGHVRTFAYDDANRMRTRVDSRGNVSGADPALFTWTYDYDANGNRTAVTDPLGNTTTYGYDAVNRVTRVTNARNKETTYAYDANGNVTSVTDARNHSRAFVYDALDRLTSETDARGKMTEYGYDKAGNRISVTTPLGNKTTFAYDDDGRLSSIVEPRGNVSGAGPADYTTSYTYDAAGRVVSETDPLGHVTAYDYDRAGRLSSRTDANNHVISWTYDEVGRLTKTVAPDLTETSYGYDDVGNLTSRTDAKNHVTTYVYDADRQLTSITNPIGKRWTFEYDASGNLAKMVDANANAANNAALGTTSYSYDRVNRVTAIDYSDATPDVSFTYDAVGNRASMSDGAGSESYSWNAVDELASVSRDGQSFSYAYNAADAVTERTYPDGTVVSYTYDDDGRLATVTTGGATASYEYDAAANLTKTILPATNGHTETRSYDRAGRLADVTHAKGETTLSRFAVTRDSVGNPTQIVTSGGIETYAYDALDRITEVCYQTSCSAGTDPFVRWAYDSVGNRTSETRPGGTTSYTYDAADRLTERTGLGGTVAYSYDDNGNVTSAGARTFAWDLAGLITSSTASGGATTSYGYDGDGKRLQATTATATTKYLWDRNALLPQLALERDGSDALLRRFVFGHDVLSATTPAGPFYYHYDAFGSVANVTDASGAPQWTYAYEPFGDPRQETQIAPAAPTNPLRFTGEYLDPDTNLYHLRARDYDAATGRFLATDPLAPALTDPYVGAYVYVNQRPTVLVDPSGLCGWSDVGGCFSTARDVAAGAAGLFTGVGAALGTNAADRYSARGGGFDGAVAAVDAFNPITNMWDAASRAYAREGGGFYGLYMAFNEGFNPGYALLVAGDGCFNAIAARDAQRSGRMCAKALVAAGGFVGAARLVPGLGARVPSPGLGVPEQIALPAADIPVIGKVAAKAGQGVKQIGPAGNPGALAAHDHHVFPQQFKKFFDKHGIDIDEYTVSLGERRHLAGVHGRGANGLPGGWNARWREFITTNPNATTKDVYQFGGRLMDEYGLSGLPLRRYGGPR